jgi:hypothetical protein
MCQQHCRFIVLETCVCVEGVCGVCVGCVWVCLCVCLCLCDGSVSHMLRLVTRDQAKREDWYPAAQPVLTAGAKVSNCCRSVAVVAEVAAATAMVAAVAVVSTVVAAVVAAWDGVVYQRLRGSH